MTRQKFDASSKWLLEQHGRSVLFLGGLRKVRSCKALQAEVVQPRHLPDGLLEVRLEGQRKPDHILVEVATYPEKRVVRQAQDDLMLATLHLEEVPDLMVLVLRPKGRQRVAANCEQASRLSWSGLSSRWKVIDLWTLSAEDLLAASDPGLIPWATLANFPGSPESLLQQCRQGIEQRVGLEERANLLAVSQVLASLKFPHPNLLSILGGEQIMIESPVLRRMAAEMQHEHIQRVLTNRFGAPADDLKQAVSQIVRPERLWELFDLAITCRTLEAFREELHK